LGAMRGAIQVLESNVPRDSMQTGLMEIVLKESDRLNQIITNFLSYARPGGADFADVDVANTITETLTLLKHGPDVRERHSISFDGVPSPIVISADVAQLKQIFWNLSRNALQAMPEGGLLSVGVEKIPNNRVRITFADTGKGMSREQVEQLFEPFSNSTSGGTGLGLSIVYQIVRDHNGAINVKSTEGKGTTITVELPRENRRPKADSEKRNGTGDASRLSGFLRVEGSDIENLS
jgi:signal transduction histidine kinase